MRSLLTTCLIVAACSPSAPELPLEPAFELFEVVVQELEKLEASTSLEALPELAPEQRSRLEDEVRGLVTFLSNAPDNLRESVFADLASHGDHAVSILATVMNADSSPELERAAAIELLGKLDSVRSSAQLLGGVENGRESWIRSNCAWRLGQGTQEWVIPRLIHRLKYETDSETVIWTAVTLAKFGNYSGLVGLRALANTGGQEVIRIAALRELTTIEAPFDQDELSALGGLVPGNGLTWAWNHPGSTTYSPPAPNSDRYRLEVWKLIDSLDAFQLRGVDDARFVLSRLGTTAAICLTRALHDLSPHTRLHCAQALLRMQARGGVAGPELVKALADDTLAAAAAEALGSVGYPEAAAALEARLGPPTALDLRVASARALGYIGLASSIEALRPYLAASEPFDLRQAAAESITYCGAGEETAELLCQLIESKRVDPVSSVNALGWWISESSGRQVPGAEETLSSWYELMPHALATAAEIETTEQVIERNRKRVALVREFIATD